MSGRRKIPQKSDYLIGGKGLLYTNIPLTEVPRRSEELGAGKKKKKKQIPF